MPTKYTEIKNKTDGGNPQAKMLKKVAKKKTSTVQTASSAKKLTGGGSTASGSGKMMKRAIPRTPKTVSSSTPTASTTPRSKVERKIY